MATRHDLIVVGGGFAGVYAAWRMARHGSRVVLIEASNHLGGSLDAFAWNGFWVDHGCHFLDLRDPDSAEFFEDLLGADMVELANPRWGAITGESQVDGFEFPDFTSDPAFCQAVLNEMASLRGSGVRHDGLSWLAWYRTTRGERLAAAVATMVTKVTGADPNCVSLDGRRSLQMFERVRLGSDETMLALKGADPFWDERLGVTLDVGDPRFLGLNAVQRFGYPRCQGLHGFGLAAARRLSELGVEVRLSHPVRNLEASRNGISVVTEGGVLAAENLFWSLPEHTLCDTLGLENTLRAAAIPVGSAFWAFEVEEQAAQGPDYLHDYSARVPFRLNKAGVYSGQVTPEGRTYVMAEVPGHPAQLATYRTAEARDACWRAMVETGYMAGDCLWSDAVSWLLPVVFTLPTQKWKAEQARVQAATAKFSPHIYGIDFGFRGRSAFIQFCKTQLEPRILSGGHANG